MKLFVKKNMNLLKDTFEVYDRFGNVRVVMKDGKPFRIGWISGITDEMKAGIVKEPEKYQNKVFEITAMEIEHTKSGYSLRHAKIVQERKDKSYEDCSFEQIV